MDGGSGDDTVRLKRAEVARLVGNGAGPGFPGSTAMPSTGDARRKGATWLVAGAILALLGAGLGAALLFWPHPAPETPPRPVARTEAPALSPAPAVPPVAALQDIAPREIAPPAIPAPPAPDLAPPPAPEPAIPQPPPLASEAELVAQLPTEARIFRLRENPRVFVLLFPSLEAQGLALNRMAALIEKAGLPRDRLLPDTELAEAIQRNGDTAATWYLGHDYNGTDLARFLALAERDGIALNPAELWVRDRFLEARALVPEGTEIALISTANPDHRMDPQMRATILRHEIGHGHFFTLPEFRDHVLRTWRERFRDKDRRAFRAFLGREGYDTTNDLLMANEAMAYLLYTPDPRFFSAREVGMTEAEIARLRDAMRARAPQP